MINSHSSEKPAAAGQRERRTTYTFHFHSWKRPVFQAYFPERDFVHVPLFESEAAIMGKWLPRIVRDRADIFVWSRRVPDALVAEARRRGIGVTFVEDGFLRSAQPNASRSPALSLTLDSRTPYFDARQESDLEKLLSDYDFEGDVALRARAVACIARLVGSGLSKYNSAAPFDAEAAYGPKSKTRILVIGQVEDDASIAFGCDRPITNNDLVRAARAEHPDADIIYKPHPDILNRVRLSASNPQDVAGICRILSTPAPLAEALRTIDRVYTITSLAGFEALLRGIPVTAFGCPFYAGWGLTDDRQPNPRRTRGLRIEDVFAAAYLLYPRYFDIATGEAITFEEALDHLARQMAGDGPPGIKISPKPVHWAPFGAYGILGWRHLLPLVVAPVIARIGKDADAEAYRRDPIIFFRELADRRYRRIGRILYPFD